MSDHSTLADRFVLKTKKVASGCIEWQASRNQKGYGQFHPDRKSNCGAHRMAYTLFVGPIPAGMMVLHVCDNPPCVNPAHLFVGDYSDNIRDCVAKGRHPELKLTDEQALEIRRRVAVGRKGQLADIAGEYGVSILTVRRIATGRCRFHLSDQTVPPVTDQEREEFGSHMRAYRREHGIPLKRLAAMLGFAASYLSRIENGIRTPGNAIMHAMKGQAGYDRA